MMHIQFCEGADSSTDPTPPPPTVPCIAGLQHHACHGSILSTQQVVEFRVGDRIGGRGMNRVWIGGFLVQQSVAAVRRVLYCAIYTMCSLLALC